MRIDWIDHHAGNHVTMKSLNQQIAHFYDTSTDLWIGIWGDHMHQGFYGIDGNEKKDHLKAQIDLIDELIRWAGITSARNILDAGCGVGGSARYLSKKFNAQVEGYTLSKIQAERAKKLNMLAGLDQKINIFTSDMMEIKNSNQKFDLIWSLESAEHIPHKEKLLQLFYELLQPGGKLILATWCIKNSPDLKTSESKLLNKIYHNYHLPPMISIQNYEVLAQQTGFENIEIADWSRSVVPFWDAVLRSAFSWKSLKGLIKAGLPAMKGALTVRFMKRGYRNGLIQFGVLHAEKI